MHIALLLIYLKISDPEHLWHVTKHTAVFFCCELCDAVQIPIIFNTTILPLFCTVCHLKCCLYQVHKF